MLLRSILTFAVLGALVFGAAAQGWSAPSAPMLSDGETTSRPRP